MAEQVRRPGREAKRLKALEAENARLKKRLAEAQLQVRRRRRKQVPIGER